MKKKMAMYTGLRDKNNNPIKVGDTVKFKCFGNNYITEKVVKTKNGFIPFDSTIKLEAAPYTEADKCEVINSQKRTTL